MSPPKVLHNVTHLAIPNLKCNSLPVVDDGFEINSLKWLHGQPIGFYFLTECTFTHFALQPQAACVLVHFGARKGAGAEL